MIARADAARLPLADRCIHCAVTSPPYFGLRDYGDPRQLGLESTPAEYVARMVGVFREVKRVLRDDGTLWLNIGDSYAGGGGGNYGDGKSVKSQGGQQVTNVRNRSAWLTGAALKPKDLIGIPWMLAFALRDDGWYLRSDIIWSKPNPMPESVTDRPSKSHEYVFLLSKGPRYFYDVDAIREAHVTAGTDGRNRPDFEIGRVRNLGGRDDGYTSGTTPLGWNEGGRNSRTIWSIPTRPFKGGHFAAMPVDLAERCIKAGTSERGVCPACAAPWVRVTESERVATRPGVGSKVYGVTPLDPESPYNGHAGDICGNRDPQRHVTTSRTVGWEPSCRCEAGDPEPARVLDPFGGVFTTVLAARRLGRIGVATELSAEYTKIGQARLRGSMYDVSGVGMNDDHPLFGELAS